MRMIFSKSAKSARAFIYDERSLSLSLSLSLVKRALTMRAFL
jgi:hypothetical protein